MDNSKIIIAAVAGAAAGAVVALLFAPEAGNELRSKLRDGATKFANDLKTQLQDNIGNLTKKDRSYTNESSNVM